MPGGGDLYLETDTVIFDEASGIAKYKARRKETERRRLSTSLDVISTEEISQVPVTTVDQLLQGRVAGATIVVSFPRSTEKGGAWYRLIWKVFPFTESPTMISSNSTSRPMKLGATSGR